VPESFEDMSVREFLGGVAARTPTPGGGAVAGAVGALSAALAQMVVSYSVGKKNLAEHQGELAAAAGVLERARALLLGLADEDAAAYGAVNELSRLPEGDRRREGLREAQMASARVPLAMAGACADLLRHFDRLAGMTNRQLRSDLAIAAILADAAARASWWNIAVNAAFLADRAEAERITGQARGLLRECAAMSASVEARCGEPA
jgi:methenyltetrahydrofolate cyclohydrolase